MSIATDLQRLIKAKDDIRIALDDIGIHIPVEEKLDKYYEYITTAFTHPYVEIAGIKWATMNVGATAETDTGKYFQWADFEGYTPDQIGDTEGKKYFDWQSYKFSIGDSSTLDAFTKYNGSDGKVVVEAEDDGVNIEWGDGWRMPTSAEFEALINATTSAWTNDYQGSGVAGFILTDNEDSSKTLFFPNAGYVYGDEIFHVDANKTIYWSSNIVEWCSNDVLGLNLNEYESAIYSSTRYEGRPLRGVLDK